MAKPQEGGGSTGGLMGDWTVGSVRAESWKENVGVGGGEEDIFRSWSCTQSWWEACARIEPEIEI